MIWKLEIGIWKFEIGNWKLEGADLCVRPALLVTSVPLCGFHLRSQCDLWCCFGHLYFSNGQT